jgi:hypothetical protein
MSTADGPSAPMAPKAKANFNEGLLELVGFIISSQLATYRSVG